MELPSRDGDELPNLCGAEDQISCAAAAASRAGTVTPTADALAGVDSAFAIALHMHQPLIPADGDDPRTARVISNLQWMIENPGMQDAHNAGTFLWCYRRMGEFIPQLLREGARPRVMLDYSGCLLHGLLQMGAGDVIEALRPLAREPAYRECVEWLGTAWGHAVAPSTPVQDFRLHVRAWQRHFADLFGRDALGRVRGFSPPEMALPNHPDVCFEFVRTLRECGYAWVFVQEHTVEDAETGGPALRPHLPHRLLARNSRGEEVGITAIVKTQGSDTKLVGQMQPYFQARGLPREELGGRLVPQLVTQIADGENGGVMMNEFPPMFLRVMREASNSPTPPMNVSEYLAGLTAAGVREEDFPAVRPLFHDRIWERFDGGGPERLAAVIGELRREDGRFHVEGGSWTGDVSWVRGYEGVLGPMESVSATFAERVLGDGWDAGDRRCREALFHLLLTQTSCFRYWGEGQWAEFGRELCRRAVDALESR